MTGRQVDALPLVTTHLRATDNAGAGAQTIHSIVAPHNGRGGVLDPPHGFPVIRLRTVALQQSEVTISSHLVTIDRDRLYDLE